MKKLKAFDIKISSAQLTGHFFYLMEMESNDSDSDCIITNVVESRGKVLKINEKELFLERCQLECEGSSIKSIRGDGHCKANCFATHFNEPLDRGPRLIGHITFCKDFSEFNEDEILRDVYSHIT